LESNSCSRLLVRFHARTGYRTLTDQTGINIVTYYAPTLLKSSLNMTQERALFVSCFLQVWYIIASFLTVCCASQFLGIHF
jgi:hypothetical protein